MNLENEYTDPNSTLGRLAVGLHQKGGLFIETQNSITRVVPTQGIDFKKLIPEDERVPDGEDVTEQTNGIVLDSVSVASRLEGLSRLVAEDDIGVSGTEESPFAIATKKGLFSSAEGMAQITGTCNDNLYACISVDSKGDRQFHFCQRYENGAFSAKMAVRQADLYRLALFRMRNAGNQKKTTQKSADARRIEAFVSKLTDEYLGKLETGELLDIGLVLSALFTVRESLPVYRETAEHLGQKLYEDILYVFQTQMASNVSLCTLKKKSYYALPRDDFEILARSLGMTSAVLRKKLAEYNLLYLTESSVGYQTKVRYPDGNTIDCYCIYDLAYFNQIATQKSESNH